MSRRAARVAAIEVLYGAGVRDVGVAELLGERGDVDPYTELLVHHVIDRRGELDDLIRGHSIDWAPERMSPVDLNVLRVGVLELLERDVPPAAVIDEAVEIAKHFSGEDAGRFVNGVLAAVMSKIQDDGAGGVGGADASGGASSGSEDVSAPGV